MERAIEPELMSEMEQAIAYANADFEEPHNHFLELLRYSIEKKILFSSFMCEKSFSAILNAAF